MSDLEAPDGPTSGRLPRGRRLLRVAAAGIGGLFLSFMKVVVRVRDAIADAMRFAVSLFRPVKQQTNTLSRLLRAHSLTDDPTEISLGSSIGVTKQFHTDGKSPVSVLNTHTRRNSERIAVDDTKALEEPNQIAEVSGRLHSVESMSAVDGPGLRYLVFLQGCPRKCVFCANPDSWDFDAGTVTTTKKLAKKISACKMYLRPNGGGITISGGEPMHQPDFVAALFQEAHSLGLTTCIDTTGYGDHRNWDIVLPHTDLVLLCLKSFVPQKYYDLTETHHRSGFAFAEELERRGVKWWLRYVVMPGLTDGEDELGPMEEFIKSHKSCVGLEVLPYHRLGVEKWHQLGREYPLEHMTPPTKEFIQGVKARFEKLGTSVLCQ